MTKKETVSDILIIAGLAAFAYYKYYKMTEEEKLNIKEDLKETGKKIVKEFVPSPMHNFLPQALK